MVNRLHVHVAIFKIAHALVQQFAIFQPTDHITIMYNAWVAIVDAGMFKVVETRCLLFTWQKLNERKCILYYFD